MNDMSRVEDDQLESMVDDKQKVELQNIPEDAPVYVKKNTNWKK